MRLILAILLLTSTAFADIKVEVVERHSRFNVEVVDVSNSVDGRREPERGRGTVQKSPAPASYEPQVILATASWCSNCKRQKQIYKSAGIAFEERPPTRGAIPKTWLKKPNGKWEYWTGVIGAKTLRDRIEHHKRQTRRSSVSDDEMIYTQPSEVRRVLDVLNPDRNDVYGDIGCGDGRYLIEAVRRYGCRAVGIEIDQDRYDEAVANVAAAGLEDKITLIHGDAREVPWNFNVATVYLFPDMLDQLRPKLQRLDKFVSYMHPVDGFPMVDHDKVYISVRYQNEWFGNRVCPDPRCGMCGYIQQELGI